MATTPLNRIVRTITQNSVFEDATAIVSSATNINQGDLVVFDTSTKLMRIAATESSDSANFLGISIVTIVNGAPQQPYAGLATANRVKPGYVPGPVFGVEAQLYLASGSALSPGSKVYLDTADGANFVQATGTNEIGIYNGPAITGTGLNQVNVRLGCTYLKGDICW